MEKFKISKSSLDELQNNKTVNVALGQVQDDFDNYWNDSIRTQFLITMKKLGELKEKGKIGVLIRDYKDPSKMTGRWHLMNEDTKITTNLEDGFFILDEFIIEEWTKKIVEGACVVASMALSTKTKGVYYVYFQLADVTFKGGGVGGDDLAKGVRVPTP